MVYIDGAIEARGNDVGGATTTTTTGLLVVD
jgi:hypothetical protein